MCVYIYVWTVLFVSLLFFFFGSVLAVELLSV